MLYLSLKYIHVLLAIVAVGYNAAYGLLMGRARAAAGDHRELAFALRTVKAMDDYVANPCYILLLLTGVAMVHVSGMPWTTRWIHMSLALYVVLAVVGLGLYTPTLRRQIARLDAAGPDDAEYRRLARRGTAIGGLLGVVALAIVWLMVFKPA